MSILSKFRPKMTIFKVMLFGRFDHGTNHVTPRNRNLESDRNFCLKWSKMSIFSRFGPRITIFEVELSDRFDNVTNHVIPRDQKFRFEIVIKSKIRIRSEFLLPV